MEMKRNDAVMKMKMIAIHRGTLASKQLAFSDHMLAQGQNLVHPLSPSENTATVQSQRTHPTHTHNGTLAFFFLSGADTEVLVVAALMV